MNDIALLIVGGLLGKAIEEKSALPSDAEVIETLRGTKPTMSKTITLDISQARDNEMHNDAGYVIFVQNPEDASVPVYLKLNEEDSEPINIAKTRKIIAPFYRFFITNTVGTGILTVIVSKSLAFGVLEAVTNINMTASGIMLPVDIQAQYIDLDTNIKKWGGTALTGANITTYLARLNVNLSTLATQATLASVLARLNVNLSTRASQTTLASVLAKLNVNLSTIATQTTLASVLTALAKHTYTTPVNSGVNVAATSTPILTANSDRKYAAIVNDSDENIYLGIGAAAVLHAGIRLNAGGGSHEITWTNLYTGALYGIHGGTGVKRVTTMEGV